MATNNDSSGNGTTSKTARVKVLAAEVAEALEMRRRDPDDASTEYLILRDGAPEWMTDLAIAAHDDGSEFGMMSDDLRYEFIRAACEALAESDDPDEVCLEPSVYTSDLTRWLGSRADRFGYCDQTLEESGIESLSDLARAAGGNYGISPTISLLALGMAAEMAEVLGLVRLFLEDMANEDKDEDKMFLEILSGADGSDPDTDGSMAQDVVYATHVSYRPLPRTGAKAQGRHAVTVHFSDGDSLEFFGLGDNQASMLASAEHVAGLHGLGIANVIRDPGTEGGAK